MKNLFKISNKEFIKEYIEIWGVLNDIYTITSVTNFMDLIGRDSRNFSCKSSSYGEDHMEYHMCISIWGIVNVFCDIPNSDKIYERKYTIYRPDYQPLTIATKSNTHLKGVRNQLLKIMVDSIEEE